MHPPTQVHRRDRWAARKAGSSARWPVEIFKSLRKARWSGSSSFWRHIAPFNLSACAGPWSEIVMLDKPEPGLDPQKRLNTAWVQKKYSRSPDQHKDSYTYPKVGASIHLSTGLCTCLHELHSVVLTQALGKLHLQWKPWTARQRALNLKLIYLDCWAS